MNKIGKIIFLFEIIALHIVCISLIFGYIAYVAIIPMFLIVGDMGLCKLFKKE